MAERSDTERATLRKRRGHQMHIWLSPHEYARLKDAAEKEGETVSAIVRRLITEDRIKLGDGSTRDAIRFVAHKTDLHKK